jgi:hypothetical protein
MPRRAAVDTWFRSYDNPMKPVVMRVRDIILAADSRIDECIKWQAPTFTYEGNLASFFPRSKAHASLMFHLGAQIPGRHPKLEGDAATGRTMKFVDVADADAKKADLEALVAAWCTWRESLATAKAKPKPTAKATKGAKKKAKPATRKAKPKARRKRLRAKRRA